MRKKSEWQILMTKNLRKYGNFKQAVAASKKEYKK